MKKTRSIAIEWDAAILFEGNHIQGRILISYGSLMASSPFHENAWDGRFSLDDNSQVRLTITITDAQVGPGANASIVTVANNFRSFSFFLRDVTAKHPIYLPDCSVVVTSSDDSRSYAEIARSVNTSGLRTRLQGLQAEPEELFESAELAVRRQPNCPTWLGLSRDMRSFLVNFRENGEVWDWIQPQYHSTPVSLPENESKPVRYNFFFGRGIGCEQNLKRWLEGANLPSPQPSPEGRGNLGQQASEEGGSLPIIHAELSDGDILYHATVFASLEYRDLLERQTGMPNLRGTDYLVADSFGFGNMQTDAQVLERERRLPQEIERDEETVLYMRIEASNTANVPRYAWIKLPVPNAFHVGTTLLVQYQFSDGLAYYPSKTGGVDRIFLTAKMKISMGEFLPMPQEEVAILLQPGENVVVDIFLPHRPLTPERAAALANQDFNLRYQEVKDFWRGKLASAAQVELPEKRIQAMFNAGLLHLDLVTYGLEPDDVTAPCIGVYCPIGSESSPIVQFFDCIGWPDLARRSLDYFIAKQHDDGFIQNFGGYMLETGAALWSMGEHFRYTQDEDWVRRIEPNLLKACDYLLLWSARNQRPDLEGRGFGMIDGKVGDPEDPYHIFMLNGYAYLGLSRCSEMLAVINPTQSIRLHNEAEKLKGFIRAALEQATARSPVVPLGDGSWIPSIPPWAETRGPVSLYAEGGNWFTHGAFVARDSLVGPLYLVFQEVVEKDEPIAEWMLSSHAELMTQRNAAFTQPYYSPHPWVHLKRGEVKPFLKAYYNTVAALADRQTFSFWEHYQLISPHKTHEEGWFLMQTRWMLYLEEGSNLRLMPGIPRCWLEDGKRITIDGMVCYFGKLNISIASLVAQGTIRASIELTDQKRPLEHVLLRLPHPEGKYAQQIRVQIDNSDQSTAGEPGYQYDRINETIILEPWQGKIDVIVEY